MSEGGRGLFPIVYDDTVNDSDFRLIYRPKSARPYTKERAEMKAKQKEQKRLHEERQQRHREEHRYF